jgi:predicted RNase H-like HicB family nuclease
MIKYPARYEKEEKFYYCRFIDFPDASTQGETLEELKENARDALSLALGFELDHGYTIPEPTQEAGDDVIWVEPYPKIRRRMGHKKDCECPICRSIRGERNRKKVKVGLMIDSTLWDRVSRKAQEEGKKKIEIIECLLSAHL